MDNQIQTNDLFLNSYKFSNDVFYIKFSCSALSVLTVVTGWNFNGLSPNYSFERAHQNRAMSNSQDRVILAQFIDCSLAPLEGLPNYAHLKEFNIYLNAFTSDIFTNDGCGILGYLVLTAPPATFLLLCNNQFIVPANPGPLFQIPTGPVTAAVLAELKTKYIKELRLFKEYYDVDKAVNAKIQQYIPEKFFWTLKNKNTGFSQARTLTILTHLWTTYGTLKEENVQDFDKALKNSISAETCFKAFVAQI